MSNSLGLALIKMRTPWLQLAILVLTLFRIRGQSALDPDNIHTLSSEDVDSLESSMFDEVAFDGIVYRGDTRSPEEIVASKGFLPMPGEDVVSRYSLWAHVREGNNTAFVSTSRQFKRALEAAQKALDTDPTKNASYVYQIEASTSNFVDVNRSLRLFSHLDKWEHVAIGGIRWQQVKGSVMLPRYELRKVQFKDFPFTPNPMHEEAADPGSLPRPELAGWPNDAHAIWQVEPWKSLVILGDGFPPNPRTEYMKILDDQPEPLITIEEPLMTGTDVPNATQTCEEAAPLKAASISPADGKEYASNFTYEMGKVEFTKLSKQFGLTNLSLSLQTLTDDELFAVFSKKGGSMFKPFSLSKSATAAGLLLYLTSIIQTFSSNSIRLARTAALTATMSFVGCGMDSLVKEESLILDTVDDALCSPADVWFFTPWVPPDQNLQLEPRLFAEELVFATPREARTYRDQLWSRRFRNACLKLNKIAGLQWDLEMRSLIYQAANAKVQINTTLAHLTNTTGIDTNSYYASVDSILCKLLIRRHAKLLTEIPKNLYKIFRKKAKDFNKLFISKVNATMSETPPDYQPGPMPCPSSDSSCSSHIREVEPVSGSHRNLAKIILHLQTHQLSIWTEEALSKYVTTIINERSNFVSCPLLDTRLQLKIAEQLLDQNLTQAGKLARKAHNWGKLGMWG